MNKVTIYAKQLVLVLLIPIVVACNSDSKTPTPEVEPPAFVDPVEPDFSSSLFDDNSAMVNNDYFPLIPGQAFIYEGENDEGEMERIEINISHDTKEVDGIMTAIVVDRVYVDDELVEETFDWYAQDISGNVWYMGEDSAEYEDGEKLNNEGSWESGKDIADVGSNATAGIIMKTEFIEGDTYQQEFYPGVAEDMAKIDSVNVDISLADGSTYSTIKILEWNPLEADSSREFKYVASGIGLVLEEKEDGSGRIELIDSSDQKNPAITAENFTNLTMVDNAYFPLVVGNIKTYELATEDGMETIVVEVLPTTRTVMGITTVVVRDTVYLDGLIIEDTQDWFAQDNDGNVWYFGEEVDNYNYDDDDNLIDITNEGAWEAGVDGAQPGIQMPAMIRIGDSYRQEYLEDEAEDIGLIFALDVEITLSDGSQYTTLKTKEWNPLEPEDGFEYKYFAEGVGLVREEDGDGEEQADLVENMP